MKPPIAFPSRNNAAPARSAWRFSVVCPEADQVLLVRESQDGFSDWRPMDASDQAAGRWELTLQMENMDGCFRYYTVEDGAVLNCGTAGLSATKLSPTPAKHVLPKLSASA